MSYLPLAIKVGELENQRKKVAFKFASYVCILSGQKFLKNGPFGPRSWRSNSVTRQATFNRTNMGGK